MRDLQTASDFAQYAATLDGLEVWSKTVGLNKQSSISDLLQEGYSLLEVKQILLHFIRRLLELGMKLPEDGAYDLYKMARQDETSRKLLLLSED